ncbi:unnamed protein product [Echinostoma caproni]|uniref:Protein kinase domain-containing protein n=1 Tax=Echinostoma caproni TaxID=27848 RepID=A0A183AWR7_9TREM|nr:unnamed protein product [Echinostoma caproni]
MIDHSDELYSSSNQSGPAGAHDDRIGVSTERMTAVPDPVHLRTSASGASTTGLVPRRRKRRVLRSLSHMTGGSGGSGSGGVGVVGGCSARIHRARGSRMHRTRRESSDTFEEQADELFDMLVMSRKACVSEVDKMRADLACIQRNLPHLYAPCGHTDNPNRWTENVAHNPPYNMLRTMDPSEARLDSRGGHLMTRSYMDSLTNVTRPSPGGPNEGSSFDDADETNEAFMASTVPENPNHYRSPIRNKSSGENVRRSRGRRLLPEAALVAEDELPVQSDIHRSELRHHSITCAALGRQSSSIPRDFLRTSSHPSRSNAHYPAHRWDPSYPITRASAPGLAGSPHLGARPPRGRSLDLSHQSRTLHQPHESGAQRATMFATQHGSWLPGADYVDEEDPSTETAALLNLTEELMGLRQGLKQARRANADRAYSNMCMIDCPGVVDEIGEECREWFVGIIKETGTTCKVWRALEMALRQIGLLEVELQRQRCLTHDAQLARDRQAERSRWERRLAATLSELKHCQLNIGQLRAQMDQIATTANHNSASQTQFVDRQKAELEETKATLDAQKEEITRLNRLLNQLLGADPSDASPGDLAQLQAGLIDLSRKMQSDAARPVHLLDPVRRTQSMHTGLAPGPAGPSRIPDFLTPNGTLAARTTSGNLYCNVPEHHYLEDCMDQLQTKLQESQLLETEQQVRIDLAVGLLLHSPYKFDHLSFAASL